MRRVWSAQIIRKLCFELYKKLEILENCGCHGNGEENQQIFYICVHHSM